MRNFEKRLSKKLKEETERIVPGYRQFDIEIIEVTEEHLLSKRIRKKGGYPEIECWRLQWLLSF